MIAKPTVLVGAALGALLGACGAMSTSTPETPSPPPPTEASSMAWLPPPPSASAAPRASAVASASTSAPSPVCRGDHVDLVAAAAGDACRGELAGTPPLASSLSIAILPGEPHVASGGWLSLTIVLRNVGATPLVLWLDTHESPWFAGLTGFDLGGSGAIGAGTLGGTKRVPKKRASTATTPPTQEPPEPPTLSGFAITATDAQGRGLAFPTSIFGVIGILDAKTNPVRIELQPGGDARAPIRWRATGYLPSKKYLSSKPKNPDQGALVPPPDPLPKGRYTLSIEVPIVGLPTRTSTPVTVDAP